MSDVSFKIALGLGLGVLIASEAWDENSQILHLSLGAGLNALRSPWASLDHFLGTTSQTWSSLFKTSSLGFIFLL